MIYPANFEQKVGFDRVREQVAALCTMRAARGLLADETFCTSPREVERRLALADEMRQVVEAPNEGAFLDVEEVVSLRAALTAVEEVVTFLLGRGEERYPALGACSEGVATFPGIVRAIDAIVDRFGRRFAARSANARGRRPSGCSRCSPRPRGRGSSTPRRRFRSATGGP